MRRRHGVRVDAELVETLPAHVDHAVLVLQRPLHEQDPRGEQHGAVLREAARPVLLFGPHDGEWQRRRKIKTVAAALDGSPLSESILPHAVKAALALSARLVLLQALPEASAKAELSREQRSDLLESVYLQRQAAALKKAYPLDPEWEVLHGTPGQAICRYLKDLPETLLAMTTDGRPLAERLIVGSDAGYCVRHGRVPLLLQWPDREIK